MIRFVPGCAFEDRVVQFFQCAVVIRDAKADETAFARKCLMNVACAGKFSSDRTIRQYAKEIWNL